MFSDTARLLARAMPTGKTVTIPASSLSENGSSYEPTEEEKLYRELLDDVKNRPPHLRIGLESVLPAKDQSPEDWARDMTQQIMARRAANEDKRNLWERFVDTSNFAASLPVRVATKGEYGLGDVLNDQGVSDAEARFAKANQGPLEAVSNLGELAGALPTWEGIGAIPKGILSNALRKAPKMPTASELSRTTFSGGIPEKSVTPIDSAISKTMQIKPTSNGFSVVVPSDNAASPFVKANVTLNSAYNPADKTAFVSNVWVRDDLRRQGVATKVYDKIEEMLSKDGKTLVPSNSLKRAGFNFWKNRNPQAVANDLRSHEDAIGEWASKKYGNDVHLEYRDGGQTVDVFKNGRSIDSIGQNELVNSGVIKTAPDPASRKMW